MTGGRSVRAMSILLVVGALAGCGFRPSSLLPLPGRHGVGGDATVIIVELANSQNLVRNAEVKVNDVTVGNVDDLQFDNWHARLRVGLKPGTTVSANAIARIGQKSLLGAEYLELVPPRSEPPIGQLRTGDVIPLARSTRFPETEEVLAALSVVLNGGGLAQLQTITTELNAALGGREPQIRQLINTLGTFVNSLDRQRASITGAIDGLDRLSRTLNERHDTLTNAIDTIPAGLEVLNDQRGQLVRALGALSDLSRVATRVISGSRSDLTGNLHDLRPAVGRLADAGKNLTQSLSLLGSFPFPSNTVFPAMLKGDYSNLYVTLDLSVDNLARNFGAGLGVAGMPPLGGLPLPGRGRGSPLGLAALPDLQSPMVAPLRGRLDLPHVLSTP
ncbi:MAG TPA: MCE family protein, partial [Pseudonocardia sp.]|nr:MCE family protein [Pseudonocardia sp.]